MVEAARTRTVSTTGNPITPKRTIDDYTVEAITAAQRDASAQPLLEQRSELLAQATLVKANIDALEGRAQYHAQEALEGVLHEMQAIYSSLRNPSYEGPELIEENVEKRFRRIHLFRNTLVIEERQWPGVRVTYRPTHQGMLFKGKKSELVVRRCESGVFTSYGGRLFEMVADDILKMGAWGACGAVLTAAYPPVATSLGTAIGFIAGSAARWPHMNQYWRSRAKDPSIYYSKNLPFPEHLELLNDARRFATIVGESLYEKTYAQEYAKHLSPAQAASQVQDLQKREEYLKRILAR